ncbi:SNF2-related, N-terminal domain-containing protein [Artemisia annua]|uniref:SNF2-related, N-terminal domain-containing protein n=1 Tax=Artemisia annua TaxID=35608 RepID=A0A2U1KSX8_ARTAN|nr:SNF2-related, N-terminal domain-containing protein [Artemisia annua]
MSRRPLPETLSERSYCDPYLAMAIPHVWRDQHQWQNQDTGQLSKSRQLKTLSHLQVTTTKINHSIQTKQKQMIIQSVYPYNHQMPTKVFILDDDTNVSASGAEVPFSLSNPKFNFVLPSKIATMLYPYQREGLKWLWSLHCNGKGGILGDDMGLCWTMQHCKEMKNHKQQVDDDVPSFSVGDFDSPSPAPKTVMNDDKFSSEQGDDGVYHDEPDDIGYKSSSSDKVQSKVTYEDELPADEKCESEDSFGKPASSVVDDSDSQHVYAFVITEEEKQQKVKIQGRRRLCKVVVKDDEEEDDKFHDVEINSFRLLVQIDYSADCWGQMSYNNDKQNINQIKYAVFSKKLQVEASNSQP